MNHMKRQTFREFNTEILSVVMKTQTLEMI